MCHLREFLVFRRSNLNSNAFTAAVRAKTVSAFTETSRLHGGVGNMCDPLWVTIQLHMFCRVGNVSYQFKIFGALAKVLVKLSYTTKSNNSAMIRKYKLMEMIKA